MHMHIYEAHMRDTLNWRACNSIMNSLRYIMVLVLCYFIEVLHYRRWGIFIVIIMKKKCNGYVYRG